jgi:hypothetical protein
MGTIIFYEGSEPFELIPQRQPEATAEGGSVVVILPVFAGNLHGNEARIRLVLTPDQAEYISRQLAPVVVTARANARNLR